MVAVAVGSISDAGQCNGGARLLRDAVITGKIELVGGVVSVRSIHRATERTLELLRQYHELDETIVLITAAA